MLIYYVLQSFFLDIANINFNGTDNNSKYSK